MAAMTRAHIQAAFSWEVLGCLFYRGRVKDVRKGMRLREEGKGRPTVSGKAKEPAFNGRSREVLFLRGLLEFTVLCCKKNRKRQEF